MLVKLNIVVE